MNLKNLTLLVTGKCNLNCNYCYQRGKKDKELDSLSAKRMLKYALQNSGSELGILFSGGEPLLNFGLIEKSVYYVKHQDESKEKKIDFSIITNGTLLDSDSVNFFSTHRFTIRYSINLFTESGTARNAFFNHQDQPLAKLSNEKNITLITNSVFTPLTADKIVESVTSLLENGVENIGIGIDLTAFWDLNALDILNEQFIRTAEFASGIFIKSGKNPILNFEVNIPGGIHTCSAAGDRITITPDGGLWGCASLYFYRWESAAELKNDYWYGWINDLDTVEFKEKEKKVRKNYSKFSTDKFSTEISRCFLCDYLEECRICPAINYSVQNGSRSLFSLPGYMCRLNMIVNNANRLFRRKIIN